MTVAACGEKCPGTVVWAPAESGPKNKVELFCNSVVESLYLKEKRTEGKPHDQELAKKLQVMNLGCTEITVQFTETSLTANRWNWFWGNWRNASLGIGTDQNDSRILILWAKRARHTKVSNNEKRALSHQEDPTIQKITLVCFSCMKATAFAFFTNDLPDLLPRGVVKVICGYLLDDKARPSVLMHAKYTS